MLWGCVVCMGACLLVASCLHRHLPCASPRADRGVGRPVDRTLRVRAAAPAGQEAKGAGRSRAKARTGLHGPGSGHPGPPAVPAPSLAFAELYGLERSTITRAIGEIRPLLARRGYAAPDRPGIRLRTLADVFAYAQAEGVRLRIDGTETQVRRPQTGRPGRRAFVSGKKKQNTIKMTTISDGQGRTLWSGADRPGRMHDQTAMRTEGIAEQFRLHPAVKAEVDEGYRGLAADAQGLCSRVVRCAGGCRGCASAGVCAVGGRRQRHCSARACPATAVTSGSAGAAVGRGSGFSRCFGTARRGCSCPIRLG